MMKKYLCAAFLVVIGLSTLVQIGQAKIFMAPSPYELIDAVNALRANNGMSALTAEEHIMASAQAHSEYQAALGSWTHTGPGGSNETDRAIAAGYGNGDGVICDEAVAVAQTSTEVDYVVNTIWDDYDHKILVLLNSRYADIGAGVYEQDGLVYYTVDVCITGQSQPNYTPVVVSSGTVVSGRATATTALTLKVVPVYTVTPQEDGSIIHTIGQGQALWSIANAYGVTVDELIQLNKLSTTNPVIQVGGKLYVRSAVTPTPSGTATETARPPTETQSASVTPRPTQPTRTVTESPTVTPKPLFPEVKGLGQNQRTVGLVIIIVCVIGLMVVVLSGVVKKS